MRGTVSGLQKLLLTPEYRLGQHIIPSRAAVFLCYLIIEVFHILGPFSFKREGALIVRN